MVASTASVFAAHPDVQPAPAPWDLRAQAYVLAYRFPKYFVNGAAGVPDALLPHYAGGLGFLMLVRYTETPVGPYDEVLFIPGSFNVNGVKRYCVTRIYVSSMASVINGQVNWGLPKALANFSYTQESRNIETISITLLGAGTPFLQATLWSGWLAVPLPKTQPSDLFSLAQPHEGRTYITRPHAGSWVQFARLLRLTVQGDALPDCSQFRQTLAVRLSRVNMTFPAAEPVTGL